MANYFILSLDTTSPTNPSILLEGGSQYATNSLITVTLGTDDNITTGYQMKIWGDVDTSNNVNIQGSEAESAWITFSEKQQIKLSDGDGNKEIQAKLRDNVHNQSAVVTASIIYDTMKPVVTVTGPDVPVISKVDGKNVASFSFTCDKAFTTYQVRVVSSEGATHETGVLLADVHGSVNVSDTGEFEASVPINGQITGADLEEAASGDGDKIIKVFCRDQSGQWSV